MLGNGETCRRNKMLVNHPLGTWCATPLPRSQRQIVCILPYV